MEEEEGLQRASTRVFINFIDTYSSKNIAKFLDSSVIGASLVSIADEDEDKLQDEKDSASKEGTFEIVGTTSCKNNEEFSFIAEEYDNISREELFLQLMNCDVIIYNISEDAGQIEEASWAVSALHNEMKLFSQPKTFILISTVMTWALSKPADPLDPAIPLTKENYLRRKPHPNFIDHITLEKLVARLGKTNRSKFPTYVVASGLQYGMGENIFHYFFQRSWLGKIPKVPVFGDGSNIIPTIHINDLAGVIQNIIDHKPSPKYFLAVDDSDSTIDDIVKAIAMTIGSGLTQNVPKEDAYLTKDLTQAEIDSLFVNLRMEASFMKDNFNIRWVAEGGIVKNIEQVVDEYRLVRGLQPIRICILGPPAVGKSTLAEKVFKHYNLQHVKLKETVAETLANLASRFPLDSGENEAPESSNKDLEFYESLKENMEQNKGELDDEYVIQIMKDKLNSRPCKNHGFVLDGFPKTYEQAKLLFSAVESDNPEDTQSASSTQTTAVIPEFVFSLDATDDFLKERVLNLPESELEWTTQSYKNYLSSLDEFRQNNTEDENVLNFFDEIEIHIEHIDITSNDDQDCVLLMEKVKKIVGEKRTFSSKTEEEEDEERSQAEARLRERAAQQAEQQRREEEEATLRAMRWDEWNQRLEKERKKEESLLAAQTADMRTYMLQHVMPTLIQGLIECCRERPDEPVDFLAEYLLKNNPDEP